MTASNRSPMDPLIEGYLGYLDKVGRKTPRTIIDIRCTLRRALSGLRTDTPLWHLRLEDYLHWLEAEREAGCTETSLAKYLSHLRGFLDYAWRGVRSERNVLDGFTLKHALPRRPPRSLTLEEAEKLVRGKLNGRDRKEAAQNWRNSMAAAHDGATGPVKGTGYWRSDRRSG